MYLNCPCGAEKFIRFHRLRRLQSGNATEEIGGWLCLGCRKVVDIGALLRLADLKGKQAEYEALRKEIEDGSPQAPAVAPDPAA